MVQVYEYAGFLFAVATLPFYGLVLRFLWKSGKDVRQANAFYFILLIHGYIDIISLLNNIFFYTLPRWGLWSEFYIWAGGPFLHLGFVVSWACNVMQAQATLLLGINRFSAIVYSQHHSRWWRASYPYIAGFIISPGVAMGIIVMHSDVYYKKLGYSLIPKMSSDDVSHYGFGVTGACLMLYCVILVIMYLYIWQQVRRHRHNTVKRLTFMQRTTYFIKSSIVQKRREKKLVMLSALICCTQVCATVFLVLKFVLRTFDADLSIYNFV
uniref:G protein-coupled receptor n=1 Tax=Bursaphelenchus xylophilus TaxID=6326 RepID=A0A1I7SGZ7_BURXY